MHIDERTLARHGKANLDEAAKAEATEHLLASALCDDELGDIQALRDAAQERIQAQRTLTAHHRDICLL